MDGSRSKQGSSVGVRESVQFAPPKPAGARMTLLKTEAWVLRRGSSKENEPGQLELDEVQLPEIGPRQLLAETLYGCWEANMTHALRREPVDVCRLRREKQVVLGNAGVVRVLQAGAEVTTCREGDVCVLVPIGTQDSIGHTIKVFGYDAPNTIGLLAKRVVLDDTQVIPLANPTRHRYQQWAGFPIRYATAWDNWQLAYGIWKLQFAGEPMPPTYVWGWGGGVSLAEVELAKHYGCSGAIITSTDQRIRDLQGFGIAAVDRRLFPDLYHDEERYASDREYKARYLQSEAAFLEQVEELTQGQGVSIFIDNIGRPVFRATLRALGRMGIITTAGWKHGKQLSYDRVAACVHRHTLVHTHGCRRSEGVRAVEFAEKHGWVPPAGAEEYKWEDVPRLAADFEAERIRSYFPVFQANPV